MKLENFSVENYRSITEARQVSLTKSTVLIGPNNEGKSNILRALNLAMQTLSRFSRTSKLPSASNDILDIKRIYDWTKDFPVSLQKSQKNTKTIITLEFSLDEDEVSSFRKEIQSNLNGTLPVCITYDKETYSIKIVKRGRGSKGLNDKSDRISKFLGRRIQFQYIPAVRTSQESTGIVRGIISDQLAAIEEMPEYKAALSKIKELQNPILDLFSDKTTKTLKKFLPGIKSVTFSVSDERRYSALRQAIEIEVNDGVVTNLEAKGDGVQSLVALGLRRHLLEENREKLTYIFAVEEPEAHLHADAIHELKKVLNELSDVDQLVITTHSGILANRTPISSNVIVRRSRASEAKNLTEIRDALGIRSKDNLINSEVILLVEGDDDKIAIRSVLADRSVLLKDSLYSGRLSIESLDGAGSLGAKIGLYKGILCQVHCFLDNDEAGRAAIRKAEGASLIDIKDFNMTVVPGRMNTEFEDIVNMDCYKKDISTRFGIDLDKIAPRNRKVKWSAKMADVFEQSGKPFDSAIKQRLKFVVAEAVASSPETAINNNFDSIIANLVGSLEEKLKEI